jgi:hypothetical protein
MKILPNTQRLGKLTFDSNQVKKSKTNPNVLIAKASDGKDYGVVRKDDGSYDYAGSSRNATFGDRMATASANPNIGTRLLETVGLLTSEPQRIMTRALTNNRYNNPEEFVADSKLPNGMLKNTLGLAANMIADPSNLVGIGAGAKAAKLAMMLPAIPGLNKLFKSSKVMSKIDDVIQPFKSEANWSKWNPETLKRPDLLEEYNNIEKSSKADGSWLKSIDGKPWNPTKDAKELGLEKEQYLSQSSKGFKKAYSKGYDLTYRGIAQSKDINPELRSGYNSYTKDDEFNSIFTANETLADNYTIPDYESYVKYPSFQFNPLTNISKPEKILNPNKLNNNLPEPLKNVILPLIHPKSKSFDIDVSGKSWSNLGTFETKEQIADYIEVSNEKIKKISSDFEKLLNKDDSNSKRLMSELETYLYKKNMAELKLKNYDKNKGGISTNNKELYDNMMDEHYSIPGNWNTSYTTDKYANFLDNHPTLNKINLNNIEDGGFGDVTIVKHKPGHFLKSSIGNVGDYDMNNPNIYKGLIPGAIAAGAAASTMNKKDNNNKFKYGGKLLPLLNKF